MKIGIDGYNLALPTGTGVATYGFELASAIQELGHECIGVFGIPVPRDPHLRETIFFDGLGRPVASLRRVPGQAKLRRLARLLRAPQLLDVPLSPMVEKQMLASRMPAFDRIVSAPHLFGDAIKNFRLTGRFTRLRLPDPPDVMHWTYPLPLAIEGIPNVYTLHDLVPLKLPYTTLDDKRIYDRIAARCVASAAQICTVSEASKRDIVERYCLDARRVTNTYQTATLADHVANTDPVDDARMIEGAFGLSRRGYFLFYGAIEPKKNVSRLIEAYLSLPTDTPLVIVGPMAWHAEQELRLIPGAGAGVAAGVYAGGRDRAIVRLDFLPRPLLAKLARGAKAVVFPSLYEGFGLPVLEALQLGTPVISSTSSSLPEVAGEAGLLVDPYDVTALAAAMRQVDQDAALATDMAVRGKEQAKRFSRIRYRERLAGLYAMAMASGIDR